MKLKTVKDFLKETKLNPIVIIPEETVENYLETVLQDDESETGGTSFLGETLMDFLLTVSLWEPEEIPTLSLKMVNESLKRCGIKEISSNFNNRDLPMAKLMTECNCHLKYSPFLVAKSLCFSSDEEFAETFAMFDQYNKILENYPKVKASHWYCINENGLQIPNGLTKNDMLHCASNLFGNRINESVNFFKLKNQYAFSKDSYEKDRIKLTQPEIAWSLLFANEQELATIAVLTYMYHEINHRLSNYIAAETIYKFLDIVGPWFTKVIDEIIFDKETNTSAWWKMKDEDEEKSLDERIKRVLDTRDSEDNSAYIYKLLKTNNVSTYKMLEDLLWQYLNASEEVRRGIDIACIQLTQFSVEDMISDLEKSNK